MNKKKLYGFTLIEVLLSLAILAFVMSAALKVFSSNSLVVSQLEKKTMARFVADNVLVSTLMFDEELSYGTGAEVQAGYEYNWERSVTFDNQGNVQINISISDQEGNSIYKLYGFKVVQ